MSVTARVEITQTIAAAASAETATVSGITKTTLTFSGGNINTVWSDFSVFFSGQDVDNTNHSVTMTQGIPESPISLEEDMDGVQINQSGTKVKIPAGTMSEGVPEIIFAKQ
jgi:hypothetical protein